MNSRQPRAELRTARCMLALERYRQAHAKWPASLRELVPEFIEAVPVDPYDGQPLRYHRRVDGVVIYSIGPDKFDNGGAVRNQPGKPATDIGFQLWDPARRRQPPAKGH